MFRGRVGLPRHHAGTGCFHQRLGEINHRKTTAAPHYRRVLLRRLKEISRDQRPHRLSQAGTIGRAAGVNEGRGFLFVSHTGEIYPSGFVPSSAGNVRKDSLIDVYRNSALFRDLRDTSKLKGKCGDCEFKEVCSGSRARAMT